MPSWLEFFRDRSHAPFPTLRLPARFSGVSEHLSALARLRRQHDPLRAARRDAVQTDATVAAQARGRYEHDAAVAFQHELDKLKLAATQRVRELDIEIKRQPVHAHRLVVVDNTDAYAPAQIEKFKQVMGDILKEANGGDMVSIATIRALPPAPPFRLCSLDYPKSMTIGRLLEHPNENGLRQKVEFQRKFEQPIKKLVDEMPLNLTAPTSPIFETLKDVTERLGTHWSEAQERELIVFSDLMENVRPRYTQYAPKARNESFAAARQRATYLAARLDLKGVHLRVYYLTGFLDDRAYQGPSHQQFWRDLFEANQAARVEFIELPFGDHAPSLPR